MKLLINVGMIFPVFFSIRGRLVRQMRAAGCDVTLSGAQKDCDGLFEAANVRYQPMDVAPTGVNPLSDLKLMREYERLIREGGFTVVHSYNAKPNIYGSIAAKRAGVRWIYPTVNGLGYAFTGGNSLKARLVRLIICPLYRYAFSAATRIFFQNADDAEELIRRGVAPREKCVVIPGSGIDLEAFPFSPLPVGPTTFFMAARLLGTKGVRTYWEAARIVRRTHPEAVFRLAGSMYPSPDSISPEELRSWTEDGTLEYLGHVSDMPAALKACSVFVLPSWYREGVPHATLEAMSVGRPVLTTDSPGCRETVNGRNGFLVPARDAAALADRMIWMLDHAEELPRMGRESRKYAEERFDVNLVNRTILETMGLASAAGETADGVRAPAGV